MMLKQLEIKTIQKLFMRTGGLSLFFIPLALFVISNFCLAQDFLKDFTPCTPSKHAPVPKLKGLSYPQARDKLVTSGWKPHPPSPTQAAIEPKIKHGNVVEFRKRGYHEVQHCVPTGQSQCTFWFTDSYGNNLKVITAGEEVPTKKIFAVVEKSSLVCKKKKNSSIDGNKWSDSKFPTLKTRLIKQYPAEKVKILVSPDELMVIISFLNPTFMKTPPDYTSTESLKKTETVQREIATLANNHIDKNIKLKVIKVTLRWVKKFLIFTKTGASGTNFYLDENRNIKP